MAQVLLIVSGGIAAYKAPNLVRRLRDAGHEVRVVATHAAMSFVTEMSLTAVSGFPVRVDLLDASGEGTIGHIELASWPDAILVAPATANLLARAAAGLADDLATTVLLATTAPVCFAPAMNTNMWNHPATVQNLAVLAGRGATFVGPDRGELACGFVGEGRMMDEAVLVDGVNALVGSETGSLAGRRVLVSTGPTRTYLDAVRFVSNASTGVMGMAVAAQAARRGARVTVVAGPCGVATPAGVHRVDVATNAEMDQALRAELTGPGADLVAMVAAVSDLSVTDAPAEAKKVGKQELLSSLPGRLAPAPDILEGLARDFSGQAFFLGFAAQTVPDGTDADAVQEQLLAYARHKRDRKGVQAVFVNRVGRSDTGFGTQTNAGYLLVGDQVHSSGTPVPKSELAGFILDALSPHLDEPHAGA